MATIKDVAKRANLSVSTVSRYLNNHPYVSEERKKRIKEAMEELNYTPSSIATQLRSKKGTMVGILVSRITNPFFSYLVDAIEKQAKQQGYNVLIMQTYDDQTAEMKMLEMLKQQVITGLIMCSVEGDFKVIESYQEHGPIVFCNEKISEANIPSVVTNQSQATYEAIQFLIQKGYHKIAYCTGGTLTTKGHGKERTQGFERALLENSLPFKKEWVFQQVHTIADGRKVAQQLITLPKEQRPDAIFTNSDEVAMGVLESFKDGGYNIPEDIAIMGFDNQPVTSLLSVPLTTIEQPVEALGVEATKLLISLIEATNYQIDQSQLQLSLIQRASV
ncbi:hypothetical protein DOK78_000896 [Enterococcus sp. DIV2402]|uniref:HTH lacI-type domain-containing protein n=1 Tax=Candidatus Enterococcus lowellii TaxID=2230877 RepID=A0ABZ2SL45_9ENTE|nr:LacI family DNA-binding transcriptional regulator [Enterococcus sp. DIV2402]MBO0465771.1 LacI family DNA-binding transcriptional regulator [Enterococcus sp. DIV2402]